MKWRSRFLVGPVTSSATVTGVLSAPSTALDVNAANVPVDAQRRASLFPPAPCGVSSSARVSVLSVAARVDEAGAGAWRDSGGGDEQEVMAHTTGGDSGDAGGRAGAGGGAGMGGAGIGADGGIVVAVTAIVIGISAHRIPFTVTMAAATVITSIIIPRRSLFPRPIRVNTRWLMCSLPLPRLSGSVPLVPFVGVAGGCVVVRTPLTDDTGGGDNGAGGVRDEGAAAKTRTTYDTLSSVNATMPTPITVLTASYPVIPSPPGDVGDGAGGINNRIYDSSLLRDDGNAASGSSSNSGHRRLSGSLRDGADHCFDGLPGRPPTMEQPRATSRRGRRSAAEAIPEASATVPRAAPAPLLSTSVPLQHEGEAVTGRAGFRRGAKNRQGACASGWGDEAIAVCVAPELSRCGIRCTQDDAEEVHHRGKPCQAPKQGFLWPTPPGLRVPVAAGMPLGRLLLRLPPAR